ncbi:ester cyclase [Halosimplex halobium]|uniref:ester cyclase n=1 Tax=Halosimplex halobium TaxID=3396618 RepID=UPI003F54B2AB
MSSDAKKQYVVRAAEAFDEHDADGFVAEFTENGTFRDPIQEDELTREELRQYFYKVYAAFPDVGSDIHRVAVSNDGDFGIEWSMNGTHKGSFEGILATGNRFEVSGASIGTVSEDGIMFWRDYWDIREFLDQLGLTFPAVFVQLPKLAYRKLQR